MCTNHNKHSNGVLNNEKDISNKLQINKENEMNTKTEGTLAIIAALLVLFSAMWDPRVSIVVSLAALVGLGIYKLLQKNS